MNLRMRKATAEDQPGLDLVLQVISGKSADSAKAAKQIENIYNDPQKYLLIAEDTDTGTICGTLFGVIFEDVCGDCSPILLIENVAVLPDYQQKGIGRQMFDEIEKWGRENSCHYEILVSGMQRLGAHRFYNALGFDEVKGFKKYL